MAAEDPPVHDGGPGVGGDAPESGMPAGDGPGLGV